MQITNIKIKNNETTIKYNESVNSIKSKETTYKSSEEVTEEWNNCLQILKDYALEILDLDESYSYDLSVISISITHEEAYGIGIVISMQKKLNDTNTKFCFNTPYLPPKRNELQEFYLSSVLENIVTDIMEKAKKFIKGGFNSQTELPF